MAQILLLLRVETDMNALLVEVTMTSLLVITILVALVCLDALWLWYRRRTAPGFASQPARAFVPIGLPRGVFIHSGHSWARLNVSGEMRLGIDELLTQALGGVDRVDLPKVGARVHRGKPLATLWRDGRSLEVMSPVTGTVVDTNRSIDRSALAVENDPYGAGWLAAVLPLDQREAVRELRVGSGALQWLRRETQRFVDFLGQQASPGLVGVVLADGAHPVVGSVLSLDDRGWQDFAREFMARSSG